MIRATMAILALTLALPGTHAMAQDRSWVCDEQMDRDRDELKALATNISMFPHSFRNTGTAGMRSTFGNSVRHYSGRGILRNRLFEWAPRLGRDQGQWCLVTSSGCRQKTSDHTLWNWMKLMTGIRQLSIIAAV